MVETGERVESREPQDHIAKPGVDVHDGFAQIMRNADERGDLDAREQRQGMPFEPCAGDSCQRDGEEKQVKRSPVSYTHLTLPTNREV